MSQTKQVPEFVRDGLSQGGGIRRCKVIGEDECFVVAIAITSVDTFGHRCASLVLLGEFRRKKPLVGTDIDRRVVPARRLSEGELHVEPGINAFKVLEDRVL